MITKIVARFLQLLGLIGIIASFAAFGAIDNPHLLIDENYRSLYLLILIICVGLFTMLFFIGKRLYRSVVNIYDNDKRPPVLYLRNFRSDRSAAKGKMNWAFRISMFGGNINLNTEEEQIAEVMQNYGPFIGIGKPGELLPRLGAGRIYVDNNS